jgi:hypothetical protein
LRQTRNYGAVHETHREVEEQQKAAAPDPAASRQPTRNYDAVRDTQHQVDDRQMRKKIEPRVWTNHAGMVSQNEAANRWIEENQEIRKKMAQSNNPGASREGQGAQPSQSPRQQNDPVLQEARAISEQTKRREAADRARVQDRERSGPER